MLLVSVNFGEYVKIFLTAQDPLQIQSIRFLQKIRVFLEYARTQNWNQNIYARV